MPAGSSFETGVPVSRYSQPSLSSSENSEEWFTLAIRYKAPGQTESTLEEHPFLGNASDQLSSNMSWAASVAECAMLLRSSEFKGNASWESVLQLARECDDVSGDVYKEEFVYLLTLLQRQTGSD